MGRYFLVMRPHKDSCSQHEKTYTGPMHGWQYRHVFDHMEGSWRNRTRCAVLATNPHWKKWPMPKAKAFAMRDELLTCEALKGWNVWAIEFEETRV